MTSRKPSKRAIKQGLALPGMQSHLNRLKASWRVRYPSEEILERWIKHRVVTMITSELLTNKTLPELLDMYRSLKDEKAT